MRLTKLNNREKVQGLAILVLLLLAVISEAAMLWSWFKVLEPQLREKAEITARALAQSRIALLGDVLAGGNGRVDPVRIREAMDSLMLITDPITDNPVILGIELEIDPDVVHIDPSLFPFRHGNVDCPDCFVTEVPVYATKTRELLGIARFYNSSEFYRLFIAGVRTRLLAISVLVIVLFVSAMIFLALLFKKAHLIEQKLQEQQAQLIHAGRITAMGEMATGIAHEINQPLTIIRLAADGLNSYFSRIGAKSMEARAARKIVSQVDRCVTIIDNMRSFVRNTPHGNDVVNLVEALERALSFFREQFRVHEIELDVKVPQQSVWARINQQKFEQIVVNLLSNAQYSVEERATTEEGVMKRIEVLLYVDKKSGDVVFSVQDTGTGMDEQVRQRCLEPFYTTKEVGEGTGLGLSIIHTILREINGASITVESRVGQGSCFVIRLPAAEGGSKGETESFTG